jgi:hypothetical protein
MFEQTAHNSHRPVPAPDAQGEPEQDQSPRPSRTRSALHRILLGVLSTVVSINLWTGGPLFALWVGSRVQASIGTLSMAAVGATIGVLIVVTYVLYKLLAWLNVRYYAATGREMPRQQAAWLKPMSGERRSIQVRRPLSGVERITVISVVVAVLALEIWFFFFAHYTLVS